MVSTEITTQTLDSLKHRHRAFVRHYCTDAGWDAKKACELAGYKADNHSTITTQAHRMLTNAKIMQAVEELIISLYGGKVSAEEVIAGHRLGKMLSLRKGDLVNFSRNNEDLGKTLLMYGEKGTSAGQGGLTINISTGPKHVTLDEERG